MTSLSMSDCCRLLSIDAKTLHQWLKEAKMSSHPHPTDGRVKCLKVEQVNVLASLHGRVLPLPNLDLAPDDASSMPDLAFSQVPLTPETDLDLRERLVQMEAKIATLQDQITDLALQLLLEREQRTEQRLLALEAQFTSTEAHTLDGSALLVPIHTEFPPFARHSTEKPLIPLIEYGARGRYVLISPEDGELHITPDSPEWFEWLASLSSFRFIGKSGRFSARRGYNRRPNRSWYAQRGIHQKNYSKYIGISENITTARLEKIAAHFQLYMK